jgi:hypothetical protein
MDESGDEPLGFLLSSSRVPLGLNVPHPVSFAFLSSTHVLSFGMAVYRIYRSGGEPGADSGFVAIGAAFGATLPGDPYQGGEGCLS